ncbi:hypothetical protein JOC45_003584 [Gordonia hydrophobica]|nr:hypothetical protein [Gordonia hydrophobica]
MTISRELQPGYCDSAPMVESRTAGWKCQRYPEPAYRVRVDDTYQPTSC